METVKGLVSIIIPVYNRQDVIEECIQSALAQTYQNFEIIIVDDGSTDNTYKICKKLAENELRIRLLTGEHGDVSAARNIALEDVRGEYVFFLDSDDVIYPLLLEALINGMENTGAAIGGTDVCNVPEQYWNKIRQKIAEDPTSGEIKYRTNEEAIEDMFTGNSPLSCIGGVLFRQDLIGNTRFRNDLHIGEDFFFIYENVLKGTSCVFLIPKWYYVRNNEHNSSWDFSFNGFWSRFYRRELVWKNETLLGRKQYADIQKRDAFDCYLRCVARNRLFSSDSRKMRTVLRKYRKEILPAFRFKQKCYYILVAYFPIVVTCLMKLKKHKK